MSNCFHFIIVLISPLATLSSQAMNSNNFNLTSIIYVKLSGMKKLVLETTGK